ncbi:MAG: hypothetical protein R3185_03655 [Candidatus Thermoplasmatota archaeon]|nr:hypothetical protein [Candidatus Thermoplasmatota archaeon]
MQALLYLGTAACGTMVDEALSDQVDPVLVLTPVEPGLLGQMGRGGEPPEALRALARLVLAQGVERAREHLAANRAQLASVFSSQGEDPPSIGADLIPTPLSAHLPDLLAERDVDTLYVSREALDILDEAGVDVAGALTSSPVDLTAR